MRKIGLDLGSKTCGIAISDDTNLIACGISNFNYQQNNFMQIINELKRIINEYEQQIDTFVLGYTYNNSLSAKRTLTFKSLLFSNFPQIKIILFDENYSTIKANTLMYDANLKSSQRKKIVDKVAASVILQEYLDQNNSHN